MNVPFESEKGPKDIAFLQPSTSTKNFTAAYADILIDQVEEMLLQARKRPLVFNLSLHPFLIGHAFRLRHLRRVFECFARHRDRIWLATAGAIAAHVRALPAGIVP
jgi:hypothetical protein